MFVARGLAYSKTKRLDDALADFGQAMVREADQEKLANLYYSVGRLVIKSDPELAILNLSKVVGLNKMYALAFYERSDLYREQGKIDLAIADLKDFLSLTKDDKDENQRAAANVKLAYLMTMTGKP